MVKDIFRGLRIIYNFHTKTGISGNKGQNFSIVDGQQVLPRRLSGLAILSVYQRHFWFNAPVPQVGCNRHNGNRQISH